MWRWSVSWSRVCWYAPFIACAQTPGTKHLYPLISLASFLLFCSVFKGFIYFILSGCFAYMYIYAPRVCSALSSQKGVSEPLELELPVTSATSKALCRCWGLTDVPIHPGQSKTHDLPASPPSRVLGSQVSHSITPSHSCSTY